MDMNKIFYYFIVNILWQSALWLIEAALYFVIYN